MKKNLYILKKIIILLIIFFVIILMFNFINTFNTASENLSSSNFLSPTSEIELNSTNTFETASINETYEIFLSEEEILQLSSLTYVEKLQYLYDESYALETRLKIFLSSYINTVGIIYYNFDDKEKISINEDIDFIAASTYKVGLNILYYYLASIGKVNLTDKITYEWNDYEEGTGILQTYDYIGSLPISELLDLSLIYSDNIATNMLGRYLGGHASVREMLYNLLDINYDYTENYITPEIECKMLSYLYSHKGDDNFSHMLEILTATDFEGRMDKYLPNGISAHKIGTYDSYVHDVGIILDDSPYILVIYTEGLDDADETIAQISKAIYQYNSMIKS